jgi:predicted dehydrogenase
MLRVGIVGFGFMGRMHYRCWRGLAGAKITAICDANPNIVEDTAKADGGNIEGEADKIDFAGIDMFTDFDELIGSGKVDVVSITLPTFMHADFSIKALESGLDVLCEKPMALNSADCQRMVDAAKASGKVLQIGHCIRFWPEYAKTKEIIDSGEYGKVIAASFRRMGAAPSWAWDNWFADEQRSGGMILDLHIHDSDYIQYLFGLPPAVHGFAAQRAGGGTAHIVTQYLYEDDKVVTAEGGWALTGSFGFEMSFNIILEKATVVYDCSREPAFRVCPAEGEAFSPEVSSGDGYSRQVEYFAKVVAGEKLEPVITLEQSRDSIKLVEAEKESVLTGNKVSVK